MADRIKHLAAALVTKTAEVAVALVGEPNRQLSSKRELRFGRKGSLAVVIDGTKAGCWYDYENGIGGDLIDLIERVRGVDFRGAVTYAEHFGGSTSTMVMSPKPAAAVRIANRPSDARSIGSFKSTGLHLVSGQP